MIDDERIYLPTFVSNHIPHGMAYVHALPLVRALGKLSLTTLVSIDHDD